MCSRVPRARPSVGTAFLRPDEGPLRPHPCEGGLGTPVQSHPHGEPSKHRGRAQALMPWVAKGSRWLRHETPGGRGEARPGRPTASCEERAVLSHTGQEGAREHWQEWEGCQRNVAQTCAGSMQASLSMSPGRLPQLSLTSSAQALGLFEDWMSENAEGSSPMRQRTRLMWGLRPGGSAGVGRCRRPVHCSSLPLRPRPRLTAAGPGRRR